jgi:hypothetical protein
LPGATLVSCSLAAAAVGAETPTIIAAAAADAVRFAAADDVVQMRVLVFTTGGAMLYDSSWRRGNLFDWELHDSFGHTLAYGAYRITAMSRDVAGHFTTRNGTLSVGGDGIRIENGELAGSDSAPSMVRVAHTGDGGQVITTDGALSFRFGDFLARNDVEAMRLSPEGNLDVAGVIHAGKGIQFPDGTIQQTAAIPTVMRQQPFQPVPHITGTQNKIAKYVDGAGTLATRTCRRSAENELLSRDRQQHGDSGHGAGGMSVAVFRSRMYWKFVFSQWNQRDLPVIASQLTGCAP